jgi:hypothetical protein
MLPELNEIGYLPPGLHEATIEEIVQRFGVGSDERVAEGQSLQWLIPMCRRAGVVRLIIGGSFVTELLEPKDVDCVLVPGKSFAADSDATFALQVGLPYLSFQFVESEADLSFYVYDLYASDREGRSKGLIEVLL